MKKLLKLIASEVTSLKRTLAIIFVILTAFASALLAVLSVMLDSPDGMYAGIDASKKTYAELYGGECFALRAKNQGVQLARDYGADLCYGTMSGVTHAVQIVYQGKKFSSDIVTRLGNGDNKLEYRVERHGYFVPKEYSNRLQFGLQSDASGILLCNEIASELGVSIGQVVTLNARKLTVLDLYDKDSVVHDYGTETVLPVAWFYVLEDATNVIFEKLYITYSGSQTLLDVWLRSDKQLALSKILTQWNEDIAFVQTYYGYLAILLGMLTLFLLYVLFTMFFRTRKSQMCRFALLGADSTTIAVIYLAIALVVIVCATVLAAACSVLLSKFLLNVCTRMFGVTYPYHFRFWLPFSFLGVCGVLACVMFLVAQKRISRLPIAEEVRYE